MKFATRCAEQNPSLKTVCVNFLSLKMGQKKSMFSFLSDGRSIRKAKKKTVVGKTYE